MLTTLAGPIVRTDDGPLAGPADAGSAEEVDTSAPMMEQTTANFVR
jgi:hypothetical protein